MLALRTVKFTTWVSAEGKTILARFVFFLLGGKGWIEVGSLFQSETSSFTTATVTEKVYSINVTYNEFLLFWTYFWPKGFFYRLFLLWIFHFCSHHFRSAVYFLGS